MGVLKGEAGVRPGSCPSQQLIHMTDARPPAAPHKKTSDPLPNEILPRVRIYSGEE